jgi:formiminotetrahydrofolate cyclodeaminase
MNAPFTLEYLISRNMNPEKLSTLERVFNTVCEEAAIPESAESERSELAEKLLSAGETAIGTTESEPLLMTYARRVVAHYRH